MPNYVSNVSIDVSLDNFYWGSRMVGVLCDSHYDKCLIHVERYQEAVAALSRHHIKEYDLKFKETNDLSILVKANEELCKMVKEETQKLINILVLICSQEMKNNYYRFDN